MVVDLFGSEGNERRRVHSGLVEKTMSDSSSSSSDEEAPPEENSRGLSKAPALSFSDRIAASGKLIRKTYLKNRPRKTDDKVKNKSSVLGSIDDILTANPVPELEISAKEAIEPDQGDGKKKGVFKGFGKMLKKLEKKNKTEEWAALDDDSEEEEEGLLQNAQHYDDSEAPQGSVDPFSMPAFEASHTSATLDDESSVESSVESPVEQVPSSTRSTGIHGRRAPVSIRERRLRTRERFGTTSGDAAPTARRSKRGSSSDDSPGADSRKNGVVHYSFAPSKEAAEEATSDSDSDQESIQKPTSTKSMTALKPRTKKKKTREKDSHAKTKKKKDSKKRSSKKPADDDSDNDHHNEGSPTKSKKKKDSKKRASKPSEDDSDNDHHNEGTRASAASIRSRSKSASPGRQPLSTHDLLTAQSTHSRYKNRKSDKKKASKGKRESDGKHKRITRLVDLSSSDDDLDRSTRSAPAVRHVRRVKSGDGILDRHLERRGSLRSVGPSTLRGSGTSIEPLAPNGKDSGVRRSKSDDALVPTLRTSTKSIDSKGSRKKNSRKQSPEVGTPPSRSPHRQVRRVKSGDGLIQGTKSPSKSPHRQVRRVKSSEMDGFLDLTDDKSPTSTRSVVSHRGENKRGKMKRQNSAYELREKYKGVSNRRRQAQLEEKRQQELKLEKERKKVLKKEKKIKQLQKKLASVGSDSDFDSDSDSSSESYSDSDDEMVPVQPRPPPKLKW